MKTSKIIEIAKDVYRSLGSGQTESVYDAAMRVGLRLAGFKYEGQRAIPISYKNHYVGEGYLDILVGQGKDRLLLELKAVGSTMGQPEEIQTKGYMKILKVKHGLLINFQQPKKEGKTKLEIKEVNL